MGRHSDPANELCCDGGSGEAEWASVSHGIYLSIAASGVHRSLGVQTSRVQSLRMDAWKPVQLRMMELGGNDRFRRFLQAQGVPENLPIRELYNTRAAEWYRRDLRAWAEGTPRPEPLPLGEGPKPCQERCAEDEMLDKIFSKATSRPAHQTDRRTSAAGICRVLRTSLREAVVYASRNSGADVSDGVHGKDVVAVKNSSLLNVVMQIGT